MRLSLTICAAVLAGLTTAAPSIIEERHVVHEKRDAELPAWRRHTRAPMDYVLPIRVGLKQRNLESADRFVYDVAHPDSPLFGQHWSAERVANMFAPAVETTERTLEWLVNSGIDRSRIAFSTGRNWLEFDGTVAEAELLFKTEYHVYQHEVHDKARIACDSYSVPESVRHHVDFIMPTIQLDGLQPGSLKTPAVFQKTTVPSGLTGTKNCDILITIDCLRAIYNIPVPKYNHSSNVMGIAEWSDYLYLPDLKAFFENYTSPKIPSDVTPEFISIDGGKRSNKTVVLMGESGESALDFQTAYSIIYPQNLRLYQNGDSVNVDSVGTFNIFLDALDESYCSFEGGDQPYVDPEYPDPNEGGYTGPLQCGGAPKSNVISISYGQIEAALPEFYQKRQCMEWMKMALQGVSVIFASGDSGVANRYNAGYNNSCVNSTYGYVDQFGDQFSPSFPPTCPYVTAVGATQLLTKSISGGERAVVAVDKKNPYLDFYSGGGFSRIFDRPSWQQDAVTTYLNETNPTYGPKIYRKTGRGFPDVSALGLNLTVVSDGQTFGGGGTSASAPIFASIINLINEERIQAGKKSIGLLNPTIYKHPEMFNDITVGANPGCGTKGFKCAKGWDPVTGMGTPNYEKMLKVFMALP